MEVTGLGATTGRGATATGLGAMLIGFGVITGRGATTGWRIAGARLTMGAATGRAAGRTADVIGRGAVRIGRVAIGYPGFFKFANTDGNVVAILIGVSLLTSTFLGGAAVVLMGVKVATFTFAGGLEALAAAI